MRTTGTVAVGLTLDATGGSDSVGSWTAALAIMGAGSAAGAIILGTRRGRRAEVP